MAPQATALQIFQIIVGSVGICGNGLVCLTIAKVRFMHTLTNAFIFNQAVIDFLGSLLVVIDSLVPIPDPLPSGARGVLLCGLWLSDYFVWGLFVSSTFNLVALTLERYLAIVFPFRYQVLGTRKKATAAVLGVWVSAFLFVSYGIFIRFYEDGQCQQRLVAHPQALGVCVFIVTYLAPLTIMGFVYVHITVVLKRGAARVEPGTAASTSGAASYEGQGESLMRARRNTFKTLLIVFIAFTVCWTPNEIIFFLFNLGVDIDFTSPIYNISIGMVAANSCLNPFIYTIKYKQFQKALKTLLKRNVAGNDVSLPVAASADG